MVLDPPRYALPQWLQPDDLRGMLRGIERECLRMQPNGFLSQHPHPHDLGAALTHPYITTDYSEALLEFITPPQTTIKDTLKFLSDLHAFTYQHLPDGERLWPLSMPCMLTDLEESIPLAHYGSSNLGRFKTLYRRGLGIRYGRRMQTIAGVHYNVSFPERLFEVLRQHEQDPALKQLNLQDYRSARYFGLIRNFIRHIPLVMYVLGASPTVCQCFVTHRTHHLQTLTQGTLYLPHATALRMGRLGYHNSTQRALGIHYNDLNGYLAGIRRAIATPYPPFQALGITDSSGEPLQINDHVLQIENEYYSLIRPKQPPQAGETPAQALAARGVAYVELRAVDIDPYSSIGIDEHSAAFLEILALYCLLLPSPAISAQEQDEIDYNQSITVDQGRAASAKIVQNGQMTPLTQWAMQTLTAMQPCETLLTHAQRDAVYRQALQIMQSRVGDDSRLPSGRVLHDTINAQGTWKFGAALADKYANQFSQHALDPSQRSMFQHLAQQSHDQQQVLEQRDNMSFEAYLEQYR